MTAISDIIKDYIKEHMTEMFYIEGKNKDYYFGKSQLNDELTVFYNDIGEITENLKDAVATSVSKGFDDFIREYGFGRSGIETIDLSKSAFNVPVYSRIAIFTKDGDSYKCQINYMQSGVLEEAIKKNPERWKLYEKYKKE